MTHNTPSKYDLIYIIAMGLITALLLSFIAKIYSELHPMELWETVKEYVILKLL